MDEKLRQLQLTMLEILKVFDAFCREHNLKYSLYAGTLLGAVRHGGFIPWDDDLDVCMAREEYDRFITLWNQQPVAGYILQNKENSKYYDQSFTKLRKDHTTFLEAQWQVGNHHTGIFIDIFPIDRVPKGKLRRALYMWNGMKYQLYSREFVPQKSSFPIRFGSALLLAVTSKKSRAAKRSRLLKKLTKYNGQRDLETIANERMATIRSSFAADMLDKYIYLPFEDSQFMCFAGWDDHLKRKFGDYMLLPPEDQRSWQHHPLIIDFDHNYEELKDQV